LLGLFERVRDRCPRRGVHLELGDHAVDAFEVGLDSVAVVAADRRWEGDVQEVVGDVVSEVAEALLLLRRGG
jgi:hypothetical protein